MSRAPDGSTLKKLAAFFRGPPVDLRPYEDLEPIHRRRFASADAERFTRLWCEIAALCGVSPLKLHEDDRLLKLFPPTRFWGLVMPSLRFEELDAFFIEECDGRPLPKHDILTVGEALDYLLMPDSGPGPRKRRSTRG